MSSDCIAIPGIAAYSATKIARLRFKLFMQKQVELVSLLDSLYKLV